MRQPIHLIHRRNLIFEVRSAIFCENPVRVREQFNKVLPKLLGEVLNEQIPHTLGVYLQRHVDFNRCPIIGNDRDLGCR